MGRLLFLRRNRDKKPKPIVLTPLIDQEGFRRLVDSSHTASSNIVSDIAVSGSTVHAGKLGCRCVQSKLRSIDVSSPRETGMSCTAEAIPLIANGDEYHPTVLETKSSISGGYPIVRLKRDVNKIPLKELCRRDGMDFTNDAYELELIGIDEVDDEDYSILSYSLSNEVTSNAATMTEGSCNSTSTNSRYNVNCTSSYKWFPGIMCLQVPNMNYVDSDLHYQKFSYERSDSLEHFINSSHPFDHEDDSISDTDIVDTEIEGCDSESSITLSIVYS